MNMKLPAPGSAAYQNLYTGNGGEEIGLDEVQLLDEPSAQRVAILTAMLDDDNAFLRFQAVLVLTAWGNEAGMAAAQAMIARASVGHPNLAPHRIHGEDNCYDHIAESIHLYLLSGGNEARAFEAFEALLDIYPLYFFESRFKRVLLKHASSDMADAIESAMLGCLLRGRHYQGSQLLPVMARLDPVRCARLISLFVKLPEQTPDPAANIAEALQYIPTVESDRLLLQYASSASPAVALQARESLLYKCHIADSAQ